MFNFLAKTEQFGSASANLGVNIGTPSTRAIGYDWYAFIIPNVVD